MISQAQAGLIFDLAFRLSRESAPIVNGSNFVVAPNQQLIGVELLLVERVTGPTASVLGNNDNFLEIVQETCCSFRRTFPRPVPTDGSQTYRPIQRAAL